MNRRPTPSDTDGKIKNLMERTPSVLKSKFLSVLGNSTDLINGLSNKIDAALSISSSSLDTETTEHRNEARLQAKLKSQYKLTDKDNCVSQGEEYFANLIDYEARKVKERRAYEEAKTGRYHHPGFIKHSIRKQVAELEVNQQSSSYSSNSNYSRSINSKSPNIPEDGELEINVTEEEATEKVEATRRVENYCGRDGVNLSVDMRNLKPDLSSNYSNSDNEANLASGSMESSDLKMWIRSESENSVPSWASSISLDSQSDEPDKFMKRFVGILFKDSTAITLELKADFGNFARQEEGRLWFARLVSAQRAKNKMVDETTFYSLVQYFAIILFECSENDDFSPAKTLMNMCFTFYHEVDVPGCEPYREYLYTFLREQKIWHSLRFWNAAFFDALYCERANRPVPSTKCTKRDSVDHNSLPVSDGDVSSSAGSSIAGDVDNMMEIVEDTKFQQNITFGQLGSFTCNMHAFGLDRELCNEFLKKQCIIANLSLDQVKMLQDNVNRMYRETDPWRNA